MFHRWRCCDGGRMKTNEIIYEAMKRINLDGEYDLDNLDIDMPVVAKLLFSLNNVLSELTEIYGFKTTERVDLKNGKIDYSRLTKIAYKIIGAKINGVKVKFKEKDTFIEIDGNGLCDIEYCYRIKVKNVQDEVVLPPNIGLTNIALGVAADYCLNATRLDEAEIFDKKYKTALYNALGLKRTVYVPIRNRW